MDPRIKTEPHTNGTDAMLQYMSGFCARYTRKWYTGFHNSLHPLQALFYAGIHIILGQCMAVYTMEEYMERPRGVKIGIGIGIGIYIF